MKAKENIWPCILQGLTDGELLNAHRMQMERAEDPKTEESGMRYLSLIIAEMARRNLGHRVSRIVRDYPALER